MLSFQTTQMIYQKISHHPKYLLFCVMSIIICLAIRIGYKSLYGLSTSKINLYLHSNIIFISSTNITTDNSTIISSIPISTKPCDTGDKYRIRASRKFNTTNINKCLHP
eukprot:824512_1